MEKGWIKIPKNFFFDWLIKCETMCEYSAWLYLCTMADDEGRIYTTKIDLQNNFGWARTHLNNFLRALEEWKLITLGKEGRKTLITIINYGQYQHKEV